MKYKEMYKMYKNIQLLLIFDFVNTRRWSFKSKHAVLKTNQT